MNFKIDKEKLSNLKNRMKNGYKIMNSISEIVGQAFIVLECQGKGKRFVPRKNI
jgi:hypothetical protein